MAKDDMSIATENLDEKFKLLKSQGVMEVKNVAPRQQNQKDMEDYDEIVRHLLLISYIVTLIFSIKL